MFFGLQCRIFYIQITASYSLILCRAMACVHHHVCH
jgi:hypothetical protein